MDALAVISHESFQFARTKPPRPLALTYCCLFSGSLAMFSHASTGSYPASRSCFQSLNRSPRIYGYFTLIGLYVYQDKLAPLGQPRGSYSGKSSAVLGQSVCWISDVMMPSFTKIFQLQEPVQLTP